MGLANLGTGLSVPTPVSRPQPAATTPPERPTAHPQCPKGRANHYGALAGRPWQRAADRLGLPDRRQPAASPHAPTRISIQPGGISPHPPCRDVPTPQKAHASDFCRSPRTVLTSVPNSHQQNDLHRSLPPNSPAHARPTDRATKRGPHLRGEFGWPGLARDDLAGFEGSLVESRSCRQEVDFGVRPTQPEARSRARVI